MARRQDTRITAALTRLLPRRRIRELARRFGALQRQRKLDIVALVYSLVLGAGAGNRRTLAGLRRAYHRATGVRLASSTFYARFTKEMATLMRTLCFEAMEKLSAPRAKLGSAFRPFREVLAVDSSIIRLHNALEAVYPSVWRHYMRASLKLTVIMNVLGRGAKTVGVTHGSHHDVHLLEAGPWVKGRLLLFDLGFFRAVLFKAIDRHGGYFLSRPRQKSNPVIVRSHQRAHRRLVGRKLRDVLDEVDEDVLDVQAQLGYALKRDKITHHTVQFRIVAIYNHKLDAWHCYVTNAPASLIKAKDVSAIYAARWEVELLFRELKSHYRLDHMPSKNRYVTECLLYAALLTLTLSRQLYRTMIVRRGLDRRRHPFDRWAGLLASIAHELLHLLVNRRDRPYRERKLDDFLRREALDPHLHRMTLASRAEVGIFGAA